MADDKKPDDYEYPQDEYYKGGDYLPSDENENIDSLGSEEIPKRGFLSPRLFVIVGLISAIIVVYLILMFINARRSAELSSATPTIETGAADIPEASSTTAENLVAPTKPVEPVTSSPDNNTLTQVAQQNQMNQQTMANLQNQVEQLQTQVTEVTNSMSTLNNQIQVLANELRAIAIERSLKGREVSLTDRGTPYVLKALMPGRAWLQARNGSTTTVTVGDRLPGYGIIQLISTDQGIVTTSSGAIIQYGPRDS